MKKTIFLLLSGFLSLALMPRSFAPGLSVLPAVVEAKASLEENPATIPCSRLPKGNVFQSAIELAHQAWQKGNHSLRWLDPSAWAEEHRKFLRTVSERRKQHFDRTIQCTAMREEIGAEPVRREGTRFILYYPSSITKRMDLPERLAETGRETAARREAYFRRVSLEGRKTRRTIREEQRERFEGSLLPFAEIGGPAYR